MSTRCLIGRQYKDKTIRYIYCHCDGYIDGVGTVLKKFYSDEETIDKLLDLGDLSALGTSPEECPDNLEELFHETFEYWLKWQKDPTDENKAAYDAVTTLYELKNRKFCHLLRPNELPILKLAANKKDYIDQQADAEFRYLYSTKGNWTVQKWGDNSFRTYKIKYKIED